MSHVSHAVWLWNFRGWSQQKRLCLFYSIFCVWLVLSLCRCPDKRTSQGLWGQVQCIFTVRAADKQTKSHETGQENRGAIPGSSITSWMTLAKSFNLFEPQFSHLWNEGKNICSFAPSQDCWRIKQVSTVKWSTLSQWEKKKKTLPKYIIFFLSLRISKGKYNLIKELCKLTVVFRNKGSAHIPDLENRAWNLLSTSTLW